MDYPVVIFQLDENDFFQKTICEKLHYEKGNITIHHFPDQETMVRIHTELKGKSVIFICSTNNPNEKIATLIFASETAKALGASRIGLLAPYLAYMRQDKQFHPGESITSHYFSRLLSSYFDSIVTIDPHLHRIQSLNCIFTIPAITLHATKPIAQWIRKNIQKPVLIGPDNESEQWVKEIADTINANYRVVEKIRLGDKQVKSTIPDLNQYEGYTPVIIDDMISTAKTMIETVNHLKKQGFKKVFCIGVHALFSENAYFELCDTQIAEVVTCNTIFHPSNKIDVSQLLFENEWVSAQ